MADKVIVKADLPDLLGRLMVHYRVYGPVHHEGVTTFQRIRVADQVDLSRLNTTLSPKSLMLPQSESMFEYTLDRANDQVGVLREIEKDFSPRIIFGIRPCDAKSFQLLDLNFDTPAYHDPWWVKRRQSTTLIGFGCNDPCSTCFCSSVGSGPFSTDGLDLLLVDVGDELAIQTVTEKGERICSKIEVGAKVSDTTQDAVSSVKESALKLMKSVVHTDDLEHKDERKLFDADFWDEHVEVDPVLAEQWWKSHADRFARDERWQTGWAVSEWPAGPGLTLEARRDSFLRACFYNAQETQDVELEARCS